MGMLRTFCMYGDTWFSSLNSHAWIKLFYLQVTFCILFSSFRIIRLKYCFNINKRNDLKIKNVLSLYTKSDCLSIIFEKEEVCNDWLKTLLALQYGSDFTDGQELQPQFGKSFSLCTQFLRLYWLLIEWYCEILPCLAMLINQVWHINHL